jgi:AcrR family transcriptional regulator
VSPRPRTVEDSEILAGTLRVVGRVGPAKLTLALVAKEVGLAPPTLIQRFGSKRRLLIALAKSGRGEGGEFLEALRRRHASPLAAVRAFLLCFAEIASTPKEMANHLAFLQMDLTDPVFRKLTMELFRENEAAVAALLQEALDAREIKACEPKELAPVLLTVANGALLTWAIQRDGTVRDWLARHVDTALRPYVISR